jgi:hypothetical protein
MMDNDNNDDFGDQDNQNNQIIEWSPEHEQILIEWADKAMCYRWLHAKANTMFSSLNAWYTIPVIVISTLTGTANFAQERVPLQYQNIFVMVVGGFNILAGIITTIQQFLKITQLNEAHRVSSIAWDKFYRNIKIEIAKHPSERIEPRHMLKLSKEEFDRLIETSPSIPEKIVLEFKRNFSNQDSFKKIIKPEICDILVPTTEYRNPWYTDEVISKEHSEHMKIQLMRQNKTKRENEMNKKMVYDFVKLFNDLNNREPMETEVIDNLKDKIPLDKLKKILDENKTTLVHVKSSEQFSDMNMV